MATPMRIPATVPMATPSTIEPTLARAADQNDALATVEGIAMTIPLGVATKLGRLTRT